MALVRIHGSFFKEIFWCLVYILNLQEWNGKKNEKNCQGSWIKQQRKVHHCDFTKYCEDNGIKKQFSQAHMTPQ